MARPVRLEFGGALYHVTARGDRREAIYEDDVDREHFLDVLGQVVGQFNGCCHAYCLMSNHYHLVIATPDGNLSKGMRQLNGVFTQWSNRRHHRTGHLFQGRYKAILGAVNLTGLDAPVGTVALTAIQPGSIAAGATAIRAGGDAQLLAGRDLSMLATGRTVHQGTQGNGVETTTHTVSTVDAGGSLLVAAGRDVTSQAASLTVGNQLALGAGRDVNLV